MSFLCCFGMGTREPEERVSVLVGLKRAYWTEPRSTSSLVVNRQVTSIGPGVPMLQTESGTSLVTVVLGRRGGTLRKAKPLAALVQDRPARRLPQAGSDEARRSRARAMGPLPKGPLSPA